MSDAHDTAPTGLRVEHLDEALGIRTTAPRLSWRLPDGAREQRGYRITADNGWNSGWQAGPQQLLVPANSTALVSLPDGSETFEVGSGRHSFTRTVVVPAPVEKPQPFFVPE